MLVTYLLSGINYCTEFIDFLRLSLMNTNVEIRLSTSFDGFFSLRFINLIMLHFSEQMYKPYFFFIVSASGINVKCET